MKSLGGLFAFDDRQSQQESSATLTATLYSVTFLPESTLSRSVQFCSSLPSVAFRHNKISISTNGPERASTSKLHKTSQIAQDWLAGRRNDCQPASRELDDSKDSPLAHWRTSIKSERSVNRTSSSPGGFSSRWIADTLAKTIATTFASKSYDQRRSESASGEVNISQIEDDWLLVEELPGEQSGTARTTSSTTTPTTSPTTSANRRRPSRDSKKVILSRLQQMALDKNDLELIKASWIPVRKDPVASGILLFRGLFTKFPQYLKFFPQFADLDLEHMKENKRLIRHAVKVIETVTFVVDTVGDNDKAAELNEALVGLVKSHLRKRIGLAEFRNLGIVLIDFICDFNNRRGCPAAGRQSALVAGWTKLYGSILDLVQREEGQAD